MINVRGQLVDLMLGRVLNPNYPNLGIIVVNVYINKTSYITL